MAPTETPTPVLSLPQAVSSAGGGQGGFLMGESRAALGAALEGFQKEPEPTLPEKPSELPRLFLEQLFLWGEKGWGRGSSGWNQSTEASGFLLGGKWVSDRSPCLDMGRVQC